MRWFGRCSDVIVCAYFRGNGLRRWVLNFVMCVFINEGNDVI